MKYIKLAKVRELDDLHFNEKISYSRKVELLNEEIEKNETVEAIAFAKWLQNCDNGSIHWDIYGNKTDSIGFSPFDCFIDKSKSIEELYKNWKQIKE